MSVTWPRRIGRDRPLASVRVKQTHLRESSRFPCEYIVPRGGKRIRVVVRNRDDLRVLRTELELLRLVRKHLATWPPILVRVADCSSDDRREIEEIVHDARSRLVDHAISRMDADFHHPRRGIAISVVDQLARGLAREALEVTTWRAGRGAHPRVTTTPPVEEALLAFEEELAKVLPAAVMASRNAEPARPQPLLSLAGQSDVAVEDGRSRDYVVL